MSTTLTIRTDESLRAALQERARMRGKTLSEVAREILQAGLEDRPLGLKSGHLRGKLSLPRASGDPWRDRLRQRNWRP